MRAQGSLLRLKERLWWWREQQGRGKVIYNTGCRLSCLRYLLLLHVASTCKSNALFWGRSSRYIRRFVTSWGIFQEYRSRFCFETQRGGRRQGLSERQARGAQDSHLRSGIGFGDGRDSFELIFKLILLNWLIRHCRRRWQTKVQ